jgi:dihydrofolate synthase/folylpolyglutamate synthase
MTLRTVDGALAPTTGELATALRAVRLPGRFQRVGRLIFDVAHNPAGAAVLATTIERTDMERPVTVLLSVLADKDWRGIMGELASIADRFVLTTAPSAPVGRVWDLDTAFAFAEGRGYVAVKVPDFERAVRESHGTPGTTVVTGSFHTVGDAMACLQVDPLAG